MLSIFGLIASDWGNNFQLVILNFLVYIFFTPAPLFVVITNIIAVGTYKYVDTDGININDIFHVNIIQIDTLSISIFIFIFRFILILILNLTPMILSRKYWHMIQFYSNSGLSCCYFYHYISIIVIVIDIDTGSVIIGYYCWYFIEDLCYFLLFLCVRLLCLLYYILFGFYLLDFGYFMNF